MKAVVTAMIVSYAFAAHEKRPERKERKAIMSGKH